MELPGANSDPDRRKALPITKVTAMRLAQRAAQAEHDRRR